MMPSEKLVNIPDKMFARKAFTFGKQYKPGDPYESKGVDPRRVRQLWNQRKIGTAEEFAQDVSRFEAKKDAERAAKRSAGGPILAPESWSEPEGGEQLVQDKEPVTADDLDL